MDLGQLRALDRFVCRSGRVLAYSPTTASSDDAPRAVAWRSEASDVKIVYATEVTC